MGFPLAATVLDDFNRANGSVGSDWTKLASATDPTINNNQWSTGTGTYVDAWWNVRIYGADVEAYTTLAALPSGDRTNGFWLNLRSTTLSETTYDGYQVDVFTSASQNALIRVYRVDNGTLTQLGADVTSEDFNAGDKLGVSCVGSTISVYHHNGTSWSLVTTRTDSTYQEAGYVGMGLTDSASGAGRLDDFAAGAIGINPIQTFGANTTASSASLAIDIPAAGVAIGDKLLLMGVFGSASATVSSITDSQGNTYSPIGAGRWASGISSVALILYYCDVGTALVDANSITVTPSASTHMAFRVLDVAGAATGAQDAVSAAVDKAITTGDRIINPNSVTPTVANDLVIAAVAAAGSPTISSPSANYVNETGQASTGTIRTLDWESRYLQGGAATAEDPGNITWSGNSVAIVCVTIAIMAAGIPLLVMAPPIPT